MDLPLRGVKDIVDRLVAQDRLLAVDALAVESEQLARLMAEVNGVVLPHDVAVRKGTTPMARRYWKMTVAAYAFLANIDLESALDEKVAAPR